GCARKSCAPRSRTSMTLVAHHPFSPFSTLSFLLPLTSPRISMKLHHLRLQGLTEAFPNEVCVDFDALGPGLIALVGENGAGKSTGTSPGFLLASIFSSQKHTGNFLSLERSERKELFIRELLGLDRLRLIAAAAKEKADEVTRSVTGLEGQRRSLAEIVDVAV